MSTLKKVFTFQPILNYFDLDQKIVIEINAFYYVSKGIFSQFDKNGSLYPIAYFSKKYFSAEYNYKIYYKELIAITQAFKEWRPEPKKSISLIKIVLDHKNLEYFITSK